MSLGDRITLLQIVQNSGGTDVTPASKRCGGVDGVAAKTGTVSPSVTMAPAKIDEKVPELSLKSRSVFQYTSVNLPGKYRICFCADVVGGNACTSTPDFQLELGTLRIQGVISDVKMSVLPTSKVISVKVESTT